MMLNGSLGGVVDADGVDDYPTNVYTEIDTELTSSRVPPIPPFPDSSITPGVPVVRTEEALIVIFVMILWVAAIALFFNRWGKIRMLEPYQPKFHQEHRPSCPLVEHPNVPQQRMSFSKYNVNCLDIPGLRPSGVSPQRLRQNSVFVGSSVFAAQPPRKTKSAVDIHDLVLNERPPAVSKSMQPMICSDRRPSCSNLGLRRMSGLLSPRAYDRRVSSCSDYTPPKDRHTYCNEFLSPMHCVDRRTSSFGDYVLHPRESKELRRPSFNNVIAQVTAERRPSSSMLRISNV